MFKIPEIMTTELFWGPIIFVILLLIVAAIPIIDLYRRPEAYQKKQETEKKEIKVPEKNIPDRAA